MNQMMTIVVGLLLTLSSANLFGQVGLEKNRVLTDVKNRIYGFNSVNYYDSFDYFDKSDPFPVEVITTTTPVYTSAAVFTNQGGLIALGVYETAGFHLLKVKHTDGHIIEGALLTPFSDLSTEGSDYIYWSGMTCDRNSGKIYVSARKWNGFEGSLIGKLNPENGEITLIAESEVSAIEAIAMDNTSTIYAISNGSYGEGSDKISRSYTVDRETGIFTELGVIDENLEGGIGMAYDINSDKIFVTCSPNGNGDGYVGELNRTTGKLENLIYQDFYHYYNAVAMYYKKDNVGIESEKTNMKDFTLLSNYPNPFNPSTKINFVLNESSKVQLAVFNNKGESVASLINSRLSAGDHSVSFDGSNLNSGLYFYTLTVDGVSATNRMVLMK